jgi:hypothetical protein
VVDHEHDEADLAGLVVVIASIFEHALTHTEVVIVIQFITSSRPDSEADRMAQSLRVQARVLRHGGGSPPSLAASGALLLPLTCAP